MYHYRDIERSVYDISFGNISFANCMFVLFLFYAYQLGLHLILFDFVAIKYQKFRSLNNLVSTRHKNIAMIVFVSVKMVLQASYISFLQYLNSTVRKLEGNKFEITYVINGRMFKMITAPPRGPSLILQVSDENQDDLTDEILPYLGPRNDWHNKDFTPSFFKSKTLSFELSNGETRMFSEDDVMHFN
jgi:hypothetical protein